MSAQLDYGQNGRRSNFSRRSQVEILLTRSAIQETVKMELPFSMHDALMDMSCRWRQPGAYVLFYWYTTRLTRTQSCR